MIKEATELVRKCKACQEHAKISHLPSEPLTTVTSPWPFQQWGVDILGPLPIEKGQCKFIIVAVDYFTKWAEAEPLVTISEQKFRDLCAELRIKNYYLSSAHPQFNGQAEVTIRTLKAALKTKLEYLKGKWVEYLPKVLWAYRTTRKSATE